MDALLKKFLPRIEFDSYEDFKANYTVNVPENFNFGFDVVDAWAEAEPEKIPASYTKVGFSRGIYGLNGGLIWDNVLGGYYVILARSSNLFRIF